MLKRIVVLFSLVFLLGVGLSQNALADIRVISQDPEARISQESKGVWSLRQSGDRYTIETVGVGQYVFKKGSQILAHGKMKGEKTKFISSKGDIYASIKFKADKIKVSTDGGSNPYEFKLKSDKIKVVMGGVDQGKIKYYSENGKLKAKNRMNETLAEFKGTSALSCAAGIYLMTAMPRDKRACLVLFLMMLGK